MKKFRLRLAAHFMQTDLAQPIAASAGSGCVLFARTIIVVDQERGKLHALLSRFPGRSMTQMIRVAAAGLATIAGTM